MRQFVGLRAQQLAVRRWIAHNGPTTTAGDLASSGVVSITTTLSNSDTWLALGGREHGYCYGDSMDNVPSLCSGPVLSSWKLERGSMDPKQRGIVPVVEGFLASSVSCSCQHDCAARYLGGIETLDMLQHRDIVGRVVADLPWSGIRSVSASSGNLQSDVHGDHAAQVCCACVLSTMYSLRNIRSSELGLRGTEGFREVMPFQEAAGMSPCWRRPGETDGAVRPPDGRPGEIDR